ncbi:MAG: hypothetical protein ACYSWS_06270 [Planctomycetota bacterium]
MQKEIKNTLIVGNQGRTIIDVLKSDNIKNNKAKAILRKDGQGIKDYFLYHSISKF